MTRVNLVHVQDLADQHLFAEWRELKMVPAALRRSLRTKTEQQVLKSVPSNYTMSTGHVLFFYDKMLFLHNRYLELDAELRNRNYNTVQHDAAEIFLADIPEAFKFKEWTPSAHEIETNANRIVQRLNERPEWYRYYGDITKPEYFEQLYRLQIDQHTTTC